MTRTFSLEVERVSIIGRFPVNEEMPRRASLHVASQTFSSSVQEYFDDAASLDAIAVVLQQLAAAMRR